jgi:methyltransferase
VTSILLLIVVFVPMLIEARRAMLNEQAQRQRGGIEPPGDVHNVMRIVYPAAFLAMIVEGGARGGAPAPFATAGAGLFVAAKALKWWAILSLGPCWTFRVLVVPGASPVAVGPYRYLRHPNYVGVAGELAAVALMAGALLTGPAALILFGWLMLKRIHVEDAALDAILRRH